MSFAFIIPKVNNLHTRLGRRNIYFFIGSLVWIKYTIYRWSIQWLRGRSRGRYMFIFVVLSCWNNTSIIGKCWTFSTFYEHTNSNFHALPTLFMLRRNNLVLFVTDQQCYHYNKIRAVSFRQLSRSRWRYTQLSIVFICTEKEKYGFVYFHYRFILDKRPHFVIMWRVYIFSKLHIQGGVVDRK